MSDAQDTPETLNTRAPDHSQAAIQLHNIEAALNDLLRRPVPDGVPAELASRYELHGLLGRGGMGEVLRGRDPTLGRELAVKILLPEHARRPAAVERFREEAQIGG